MNKYLTEVENFLNLYFGKKAPAMPENIKELIVKYSPYIAVIVLIISLPALLISFGLTAFLAPFSYAYSLHSGFNFSIGMIFSLASVVLEIMAIPGLFKRLAKSWQYMFYASLINLVSYLFNLNLASLIISGIISFYILFQIKSYYKN